MNPHQLIIAGQIGFALRAVGNHVFNCGRVFRLQFHRRWESGTAQADNTGSLHALDDLAVGQLGCFLPDTVIRSRREQPVIVNNDAHCHASAEHTALFDRLDLSGAA